MGWVIPVHSWRFSVLLLWSSGGCLSLHASPTFPVAWCVRRIWDSRMSWWIRSGKQHRSIPPCSSLLWASLFAQLLREDFCEPQCAIGPCSLGEKEWDTKLIQKGCALLINDPGLAEGFRENFSILKLVLEFLQKWEGMVKLCPWIEGYWRNLIWGVCVCVCVCICVSRVSSDY